MKKITNLIASDGFDTVRISISTVRDKAQYASHEVIKHHLDIVDDVHAAVAKKYRVHNIQVR